MRVAVRGGTRSTAGVSEPGTAFSFHVSRTDPASPRVAAALRAAAAAETGAGTAPASPPRLPAAQPPAYLTAPADFPQISLNLPGGAAAPGYLFASNFLPNAFLGTPDPGAYLLILDNAGQPVYYQPVPSTTLATDFKVLGNGELAYWQAGAYHLLDSGYREVRTLWPGNGYPGIDLHDLLLLPNGDFMFLVGDTQAVDMSKLAAGGSPNALVLGIHIQELDPSGNVVFDWSSFDHLPITDSNQDLTASSIDYIHSNSLELDGDGNILLSSRNLSEVTKISRATGAVIWRLGGKANQFTFSAANGISDPPQFYYQHDARRLPDGHLTLFDNHDGGTPMNSRALEHVLDETSKTAALVWEYRDTPDVYSSFMGNVQRLNNGDTLIGWGGSSNPSATEIAPDGTKVFELAFSAPYASYRVRRYAWHATPSWPPVLAASGQPGSVNLAFSWNGATDITAYNIYAGNTTEPDVLVSQQPRTGFETRAALVGPQAGSCYYRVMPLDSQGRPTRYSNAAWNPA
ncbi:MAG TPA: aryl-sulfate sulfotransferase, partial [Anaerolineaceae bacterium]